MHRVLVAVLYFNSVLAKHEVYDGYSIFQVSVKDLTQIEQLNSIVNMVSADVWSQALPDKPGQVLIAEDKKQKFQQLLDNAGMNYQVQVENVKVLLDLEDELLAKMNKNSNKSDTLKHIDFNRIYTYEEVNAYLEKIAAIYPDIVTLVVGGYSFEGRPIKYLKISTTDFKDHSKPIVYMESLIHAREWITLSTTLYAIEQLVIDVHNRDLLEEIDWIILPIVNPDGYIYTHEENRLWRKNRATSYMIGDVCSGVDLNRNFDVLWSTFSSSLVCSETFHGRSPFSEPETNVIRNIILEYQGRMELFLDIHSFGSMILYGYGSGTVPPNGNTLHVTGTDMAAAIDSVKMSWNPDYTVGNTAEVLYQASGSAPDFAQIVGVPLSYTFELPGYRFGLGSGVGFLVDPSFIEQAGFETWEGIKVGARFVKDHYRRKNVKSINQ